MLTFSSICDKYIECIGCKKRECKNDEEAKKIAYNMSYETIEYPVVYFTSDTTGEKTFEEFYSPGEQIDMQRFDGIGVIEETTHRSIKEIDTFFKELEDIFANPSFTKEQVVASIKKFIPNFDHEEKGKNLDQKM